MKNKYTYLGKYFQVKYFTQNKHSFSFERYKHTSYSKILLR